MFLGRTTFFFEIIENGVSEHTRQAFGVDHIDFSFVLDQDVNLFTLSLIGCNMDRADTKFLVVEIGRHSHLKNKFKILVLPEINDPSWGNTFLLCSSNNSLVSVSDP